MVQVVVSIVMQEQKNEMCKHSAQPGALDWFSSLSHMHTTTKKEINTWLKLKLFPMSFIYKNKKLKKSFFRMYHFSVLMRGNIQSINNYLVWWSDSEKKNTQIDVPYLNTNYTHNLFSVFCWFLFWLWLNFNSTEFLFITKLISFSLEKGIQQSMF